MMVRTVQVQSLLLVLPGLLAAQGVTSAAVEGRVLAERGVPVADATVALTDVATGARWVGLTRAGGGYLLENVGVGGPYRMRVVALGYAPEERTGVMLALGQRFVADFVLRPEPLALPGIDVTADADASFDPGQSGVVSLIRRRQIDELPNPGRSFLALTTLSPLVAVSQSAGSSPTGGITIGGQNRLYNALQIDGGLHHDLYEGRLPGRETLPRPIALDALEEIQVHAAPFDVRHGSFAGGLVNAVTRSGTNDFHGSAFAFLSDAALVGGGGATARAVDDFTTWQLGGTLGGPIVRDRAHFFLSVDAHHEVVPDAGPLLSDLTPPDDVAQVGVSQASALRFQEILDSLGLHAGSIGPVPGNVRARDLFGKVTLQLGANSRLELSHHYARGDRWGFLLRTKPFYFLSTTSDHAPSTVQASRLIWTALFGRRWSNELIVSRLRLDDTCGPTASYPEIRARFVDGAGTLVAGAGPSCPRESPYSVVQDALELTENLTAAFGEHVVTLGIRGKALRFRDAWLEAASGHWVFRGLTNFAAGNAMRYRRGLPGPSWGERLDFRAGQAGVYAQDRWRLSPWLALTLGLRLDVPILPEGVARNDALDAALGIRTAHPPGDRTLWSPRLGVNYQLGATRPTSLRGGVGLFSGPPPYRWLANAYRDDGTRELFLDCRLSIPRPAFDPTNPPETCGDGSGPLPRLSTFAPGVHFPQSLKVALGVDHEFPRGVVGTVDVLYTRSMKQLHLRDANLVGPQGTASGEGDRLLYGTIAGTVDGITSITPARRDPTFGRVIVVENRSGDHAWSVSARLRKRFGELSELEGAYAFTRARDRMSLVNPTAQRSLENSAADGRPETRPLRPSYFEVPHRVQLSATLHLGFDATLSLLYSGSSGTPFTYVVAGADVNADGIPPLFTNDPVYVPRDRDDITIDGNGGAAGLGTPAEQEVVWAEIDARIESERRLREQRGRLLERNSCRNPWFGTVSARLAKALRVREGHALEVTADLCNLFDLLGRSWGTSGYTGGPDAWWQGLLVSGWDATEDRGVYSGSFRAPLGVDDLASRWRTELTVRYVF